MIHYVDSSALIKLIRSEIHSAALVAWIEEEKPDLIISELVVAETLRAARRAGPDDVLAARHVLGAFRVRAIRPDIWSWAGEIDPQSLRTLDALHLAVALSFGPDLDSVVTYDTRLSDACAVHGIRVLAPV